MTMDMYFTTTLVNFDPAFILLPNNFSSGPGHDLNSTQQGDHSEDVYRYMEAMTTPLVSVVGTVLNLLTVGAFLSKSLRKISCSLYLAVRSLAVFGFLVSMFIAWTNTFTPLVQQDGICQLTVFLSYFCPFVSVWMVVIISVENFIRISQPARVARLCTPRVAKFVILIVMVVGLVVYNFPLWAVAVHDGSCSEKPNLIKTVLILNNLDTVLTLLCPFVLMIVVVPLVALTAIHAYERKKRLNHGLTSRNRPNNDTKCSPEKRVTHLLLAVSVVFLLFHIPFHAIRIKLFFLTLTKQKPTKLDQSMYHILRLIFNFDTVLSCAVYLVFGDNFRRVFCRLYFSRCNGALTSTVTADLGGDRPLTPTALAKSPKHNNGQAEFLALLPDVDNTHGTDDDGLHSKRLEQN